MTEIPEPIPKPGLIILAVIAIIIAGAVVFLWLSGTIAGDSQAGENQVCRLDGSGHLVDPCVPIFKIVNGTNNSIKYDNFTASDLAVKLGESAPSPEECNHYAEIALEPFGGIPKDAVLTSISVSSSWASNNGTAKSLGIGTRRIYYRQMRYEMPVYGNAGSMSVELGARGVLSGLNKHWLTLEETGMTRIVPASEAIKRLETGQGRDTPDLVFNLTIQDMQLGYYTPVNTTVPQYLVPIWIVNATDEIRGRSLTLYVPAESASSELVASSRNPSDNRTNFTQIRNTSFRPDVSFPVRMWLGTSGPVGKEKALETIKKFTENPGINLSYEGRFFEHGSGGCGGSSYFWDYYEFLSPTCNFKVDAFTGTMISASLDPACSDAGIGKFSLEKVAPPKSTLAAVTNFTRDRYYHFNQRHLNLTPYDSYDYNNLFVFEGDRALQSDYGVRLVFNTSDGLLSNYMVTDDYVQYLCSGVGPVKIREE